MQYTECFVNSGRIKILYSKCKILFKRPRLKAFFSKDGTSLSNLMGVFEGE